jgi:anti-anti-sigma factor
MSLPELKVAVLNSGTTAALTIVGHLNALTVGVLESNLDAILSTDARRIVLDCSGLSFTSSAGLRVFLATVKRMKSRGGTCAFASLTPAVNEVFEMAGFLETMEIHTSRESALLSENL